MPKYEATFGLMESDVVALTDEQRCALELHLNISIADEATWKYYNFRYPRWKNAYGYVQVMSGEFVVQTIALSHINQEILYWFDSAFQVNQTTGCYARALSILIGNGVLTANNVRRRQRYTSIRVKLFPGVLANCVMNWTVAEPICEDSVFDPNEENGKPPDAENHKHNPGAQPPGTQEDPEDPTVNDSDPYNGPNDPKRPPYAEILPGTGQWVAIYSGYNPGCSTTYSNREYLLPGATDPNITPIVLQTGSGTCGPPAKSGTVTYNGAVVDTPIDYTSYVVVFRET